jgi:rubrerythrin
MTKKDKQAEKEHKESHKVYQAGGKYHCSECGAEIEFGTKCPTCKLDIDWKLVDTNMRR